MELRDKVVAVTGGGNGIGRDVVLELLGRGATVAALDLRSESLDETVALAHAGDRLTRHLVDVGDPDAVAAVAAEVLAAHLQVDALMNVAGIIQPFVPFTELEPAAMQHVMDVNFWGVVHTCRAFLPHLLTRPEAALVNVSSMGALVPVPGQTLYGASKAAVKLLTEGLYAELRGTSVAVTIAFPGAVATAITANSGVAVPAGAASAAASEAAVRTTSSPEAARQLVDAMAAGRPRITIGSDATALDRLSRLSPVRATEMVAKKMRELLG